MGNDRGRDDFERGTGMGEHLHEAMYRLSFAFWPVDFLLMLLDLVTGGDSSRGEIDDRPVIRSKRFGRARLMREGLPVTATVDGCWYDVTGKVQPILAYEVRGSLYRGLDDGGPITGEEIGGQVAIVCDRLQPWVYVRVHPDVPAAPPPEPEPEPWWARKPE